MTISKGEIGQMLDMVFTKQEAQEAVNRIAKFFQSYDGDFFGLDDIGIIDVYINQDVEVVNDSNK